MYLYAAVCTRTYMLCNVHTHSLLNMPAAVEETSNEFVFLQVVGPTCTWYTPSQIFRNTHKIDITENVHELDSKSTMHTSSPPNVEIIRTYTTFSDCIRYMYIIVSWIYHMHTKPFPIKFNFCIAQIRGIKENPAENRKTFRRKDERTVWMDNLHAQDLKKKACSIYATFSIWYIEYLYMYYMSSASQKKCLTKWIPANLFNHWHDLRNLNHDAMNPRDVGLHTCITRDIHE